MNDNMHAAGRFRAIAREANYGKTSNGNDQIAVLFELETGARLTWYGYLTDKTQERTLESLVHCGVTDLESLAGLGSKEVDVEVRHEEYQGKWSARIAFVNTLGSGGAQLKSPMNESEKKSVAARLKGNFVAMQKQYGQAPSAQQPAAPPGKAPF